MVIYILYHVGELYMDLNDIVDKYNLCLLLAFGSYNTDRFTEKSDIDLAYLSNKKLNIEELSNHIESREE